ncbi:MAG: SMC-Scp complex subunit ScpB [Candidatus Altiarchaeota archaeon]|nr:SMC-Scp complex subunit ScpB [Candidatus Altiarchaeota archaeon]
MSSRAGMDRSLLKDWLEAALFISGRTMSIDELVKLSGAGRYDVIEELDHLSEKHQGPIVLVRTDTTAKMTLQDKYQKELWMLGHPELGKGELRTLTVVAYYEPIKQSDVVRMRGNKTYEQVASLESNGFVRSQKFGRTKVLRLGHKFFEYFGDEVAERIRNSGASAQVESQGQEDGQDLEGL